MLLYGFFTPRVPILAVSPLQGSVINMFAFLSVTVHRPDRSACRWAAYRQCHTEGDWSDPRKLDRLELACLAKAVAATMIRPCPYFMKPKSFLSKRVRSGKMSLSTLSLIPIHFPRVAAYCEAAVLGSSAPPDVALSGPLTLMTGSVP